MSRIDFSVLLVGVLPDEELEETLSEARQTGDTELVNLILVELGNRANKPEEEASVYMLPEEYAQYLRLLGEELNSAFRYGGDGDEPEGSRYIKVSDTLAMKIADNLLKIAESML